MSQLPINVSTPLHTIDPQFDDAPPLQTMQLVVNGVPQSKKPALLLLHGWGSSSAIWSAVREQLELSFNLFLLDLPGHGINANLACASIEEFCLRYQCDVEPQLPANYFIAGWSLGGALASVLAAQCGGIKALVTIATNPVFVARATWCAGMPEQDFARFQFDLQKNGAAALRRFLALQTRGADTARADLRWVQQQAPALAHDLTTANTTLHWLAELDLRACYASLAMPVFHYLGAHDQLVPQALGAELAAHFPSHQLRNFEHSSHLPFVTEQALWLQALREDLGIDLSADRCADMGADMRDALLLQKITVTRLPVSGEPQHGIDKRALAKAFSRAAPRYESIACLQRAVGERLLAMLGAALQQRHVVPHRPSQSGSQSLAILDLGAGTGYFARRLAAELVSGEIGGQFLAPAQSQGLAPPHVIELDLSAGMLQESRRAAGAAGLASPALVLADFDNLPFAPQAFELAFANLALQWCDDLQRSLCSLHALLKRSGVLAFTTLLDGSLHQLRNAWAGMDATPRVNAFASQAQLLEHIENSPFTTLDWHIEERTESFRSIAELLQSVKGIGAGNHLHSRSRGLLGRSGYKRFCHALEQSRNPRGEFELSYSVFSAVLLAAPDKKR